MYFVKKFNINFDSISLNEVNELRQISLQDIALLVNDLLLTQGESRKVVCPLKLKLLKRGLSAIFLNRNVQYHIKSI